MWINIDDAKGGYGRHARGLGGDGRDDHGWARWDGVHYEPVGSAFDARAKTCVFRQFVQELIQNAEPHWAAFQATTSCNAAGVD